MLVPGLGDLRAGRGLRPAENVVPLVGLDAVTRCGPRLVAGSWLRSQGLASMAGASR